MPTTDNMATVTATEFDVTLRRRLNARTSTLVDGAAMSAGRDGDLVLGANPADDGVSRRALEVTFDGRWRLHIQNRNGAVVQPWGQAPLWVEAQTKWDGAWSRIGVRLIGSVRSVEHWVLLECPQELLRVEEPPAAGPGPTRRPDHPKPLTQAQRDAVHTVFREFLAWPPASGPLPVPLAAAAGRLGISSTALQERLSRVQDRAYHLGLHQQPGVSDPGYIHLLVRHGYIRCPSG